MLDSTETMRNEKIEEFTASIAGSVIGEADAGYDDARSVWNASIDKHPAMIVRCKGVADVIRSVNFARQQGLLVAVRGGGHNVAGNSTCDGGMVIDLGAMNGVHTDVGRRLVRVEGGATIRDVDRETQMFGLAVPLGIVSETGIGGLTLCGGHSWLNRLHGFACDNLVSVDLVTAKGELVRASEDENSELFWAVRGGGGNFGIVTSFEFRAHSIGNMVTLCAPFFPIDDGARIMRAWRDYMASAPDTFTAQCLFWTIPAHESFPADLHGRPVIVLVGVYCGPQEEAAAFVQPLRDLGTPLVDLSGPIPYEAVQQAFDPHFTARYKRFNYWKSLYMDALSDATIDRIVARGMDRPNPWTLISTRLMGGAPSRVDAGATALGGRDAAFMLSIDTSWTDPEISDAAIEWTRSFWDEMKVGTGGSAYLNFLSDDDDHEALMRASYGQGAYDRLTAVKAQYDPGNFFSLNQNIPPK